MYNNCNCKANNTNCRLEKIVIDIEKKISKLLLDLNKTPLLIEKYINDGLSFTESLDELADIEALFSTFQSGMQNINKSHAYYEGAIAQIIQGYNCLKGEISTEKCEQYITNTNQILSNVPTIKQQLAKNFGLISLYSIEIGQLNAQLDVSIFELNQPVDISFIYIDDEISNIKAGYKYKMQAFECISKKSYNPNCIYQEQKNVLCKCDKLSKMGDESIKMAKNYAKLSQEEGKIGINQTDNIINVLNKGDDARNRLYTITKDTIELQLKYNTILQEAYNEAIKAYDCLWDSKNTYYSSDNMWNCPEFSCNYYKDEGIKLQKLASALELQSREQFTKTAQIIDGRKDIIKNAIKSVEDMKTSLVELFTALDAIEKYAYDNIFNILNKEYNCYKNI